MEEFYKSLEEVVLCIKDSKEYKNCISIKKKMNENDELITLIKEIKSLQKKYIRTPSIDIKKKLESLEKELNEIPIYHIYLDNLQIVNEKIEYVKSSLNEYFDKLLNIK